MINFYCDLFADSRHSDQTRVYVDTDFPDHFTDFIDPYKSHKKKFYDWLDRFTWNDATANYQCLRIIHEFYYIIKFYQSLYYSNDKIASLVWDYAQTEYKFSWHRFFCSLSPIFVLKSFSGIYNKKELKRQFEYMNWIY
jgi:hypothetical protein